MPCVSPLVGWHSGRLTANGKKEIVFTGKRGGDIIELPCGQCIGCRLEYARSWAVRCMHEASLHDENAFITLTYDEEHIPDGQSLSKKDCQKFLKRLRSRFDGKAIRYYLAGEYGSDTLRPHYHALLFGFDLPDKKLWSVREGYKVWTSEVLEETWGKGLTEIGSVTFESAAYCARYMVQKFKGPKEVMEKYYDGLEPEFALMSRGNNYAAGDPRKTYGIGYEYYRKHGKEIHEHDSVIINGREQKPPQYYDRLLEKKSVLAHEFVKKERKERALRLKEKDGRGDSKLLCEKKILEARVQLRKDSKNANANPVQYL